MLVVEDDADARELVTVMLREAGAQVTAVGSTGEALRALDRTRPDVLVSDISLPGEDGYTLIRNIRMREARRGGQMPAVAVTAYASLADRNRASAAGYQAHLSKPVDTAQLINAIAALARPEHQSVHRGSARRRR